MTAMPLQPAPRLDGAAAPTGRPLAINGRFLAHRVTGVQRYAREIVTALDRHLEMSGTPFADVVLLRPPSAPHLDGLKRIREAVVGTRQGHGWEQIDLPRAAAGMRVLSLGNAAPLAHRRQVVTFHDAGIYAVPESYAPAYRLWYRLQFAWLARRAERVVTVSAFSAGELVRHAGVPRDKLAVVPNAADHLERTAADPTVLARHRLKPGEYAFVIGSGRRHKNLVCAAAAVARMPPPRPQLVVAGNADPAMFAASGLGADTIVLGGVTEEELRALYAQALCLLFPSHYEGFGIPPLEAMTCGCPVVAAKTSALPEVCGNAVLYGDPDDPDSFRDAMQRLRTEPEMRRNLIMAGHGRAQSFSWARSAARLVDILMETDRRCR